ncbi:MAG: DUF2066 domain-containing protein [Alphaproteobacteria bacterium]|nr:DUF2066 domain-containing protein [Alphaproteobacteria bacterium]
MRKLLVNNGLFAALVASFMAMTVPTCVFAQSADNSLDILFTIRDIRVDETATRASEARRTALAKAEQEAYFKLLRKLTQPEGRAKLPTVSARAIQTMISGIEVVNEQSSSRRYLATLNVRFEPGLVSQFLAEHDVPHVLGTGRGMLVLHAHAEGLHSVLWEHDAEVSAARSQVDWLNRIRQYVFPFGDMAERSRFTYEEASSLDTRDAKPLTVRYQVNSALIISSRWVVDGDRKALIYDYVSTDGDLLGHGAVENSSSEVHALVTMYDEVLDNIDSAWRAQLLVDTGEGGVLEVLVPSTEFPAYQKVLNQLAEVSLVGAVERLEIGLPFSKLRFPYTGRLDQLTLALRYAGLDISDYGEQKLLAPRPVSQN